LQRSPRYEQNKAAMRRLNKRKRHGPTDPKTLARWRRASRAYRQRQWESGNLERKLEMAGDRERCWHRLLCLDRCQKTARWINTKTGTTWCDEHKPDEDRWITSRSTCVSTKESDRASAWADD